MRKVWIRKDVKPGRGRKMKWVKIPDKGKKGLTPKSGQWSKFKHRLGWKKEQPEGVRRAMLIRASQRFGGGRVGRRRTLRAINQLANKTTNRETQVKARSDVNWMHNMWFKRRR